MSVTSVAPEQLRPELHQRIDRMDAEQLQLLQHILLKLDLDQLVAALHESFDAARRAGRLSRLMKSFMRCARGIRTHDGLH